MRSEARASLLPRPTHMRVNAAAVYKRPFALNAVVHHDIADIRLPSSRYAFASFPICPASTDQCVTSRCAVRRVVDSGLSPVRSNQRDFFHVSTLREQADNVLRAWLGASCISLGLSCIN